MKYLVIPLCIFLYILLFPIEARDVSSDTFILEYKPLTFTSTRTKYKQEVIKRRMPLEHTELNTHNHIDSVSIPLTTERTYPKNILPDLVFIIGKAVVSFVNSGKRNYVIFISRVATLFGKKTVKRDEVNGALTKEYMHKKTVDFPKLEQAHGLFSQFKDDPYGPSIPEKFKEVYTWDRLWNPAYNPQEYLQCTAYVAMIYNLNGISLHGKVSGDAKDWIHFTDSFTVFENGKTTETPRIMDIMVWAKNGNNHVGVVSTVTESTVTIVNSNSPEASYTYQLSVSDEGLVSLSGQTTWIPSHWMRLK